MESVVPFDRIASVQRRTGPIFEVVLASGEVILVVAENTTSIRIVEALHNVIANVLRIVISSDH